MPILEPPVDLTRFPITHGFWIDDSANQDYRGFYDLFDGHHPGVDFDLPEGSPIGASLAGIVVRKEFHQGMGNILAIRLGNIYVLYAHLKDFCVDQGQLVRSEQPIAYSGNTGQATTAPHLHFELRDLREKELIKMVFEPKFGKPVERYQSEFIYHVNNDNQPKNFLILASRYFGDEKFAPFLRDKNPDLRDVPLDSPLPQGAVIVVPSPKLETGS